MSLGYKPAFPDFVGAEGLTIRQYYAGLAMQGIIQSDIQYALSKPDVVASWAIDFSDALIAELEKSK